MTSPLARAASLLAAACLVAAAPNHAAASATPVNFIVPESRSPAPTNTPAVRTITIDGREYTVTLVVRTWSISVDPNHPTRRQVAVNVSLDTVDGNVMPVDIAATRVRLTRVAVPHRVFRRELTSLPTIASLIGHAEFGNDDPLFLVPETRFRAVVRIEHAGGVLNVPMGITSVIPTRLTLSPAR